MVRMSLAMGSEHFAQKNGDILLVQNSPGTRLLGCVIFFDCKILLHLRSQKL